MSAPGHTERSRRWLEEQVEHLASLRTANPRDPSFKLWRQNTLTILQRIWPGEQARSERFRRITFSPAAPKADFNTTREAYTRGCAEAVDFLRSLLTEVDAIGVPQPGSVASAPQLPASAREDDFPVLELPSLDMSSRAPGGDSDFVLLDADGTAAALAPQEDSSVAEDSNAPVPPTLRVEPRMAPAPSSAPESAPPKLPARTRNSRPAPVASPESLPTLPTLPATSATRVASPSRLTQAHASPPAASPPSAPQPQAADPAADERRANSPDRRTSRTAKPRRGAVQPRLKDLLGLQNFGNYGDVTPVAPPTPEAPVAIPSPAPPAPVAAARPAPPAPVAAAPQAPPIPPAPVAAARPAPPAPVAAAPQAPPAPVAAARPAPPAPVAAAPPAPPLPPAPVAAARPAPPAPVAAAPPAPPLPPAPAIQSPADGVDFAQATADFMRNSPVLGLQGRPVQRAGDSTQFLEPDAVALVTLAIEVGRHVSDEAAREPLRVALFGLAAQVEAHAPEWSSLRTLVAAAMEHPELARRLLPILLPWLGRAA